LKFLFFTQTLVPAEVFCCLMKFWFRMKKLVFTQLSNLWCFIWLIDMKLNTRFIEKHKLIAPKIP